MNKTALSLLLLMVSLLCPSLRAANFVAGEFVGKPRPEDAPVQLVELTKKENEYWLRIQIGGDWHNVGKIEPMSSSELKEALGTNPASVDARALSNGAVAYVLLSPGTKIRGITISSGIALISPFLGPQGVVELVKK